MYKILFVDDEQIVRDGIEHTIDWPSLGFQFVGAFENGIDADAAVDALEPSVVITDILMPFRDGLELTEQIVEKHPEIKVILLSGFDEFKYAQRALRLGAYDYILKPITAAELRSLLQRVRGDLDAEVRRSEELAAISQTLSRSRETRITQLTERLMTERPPAAAITEAELEAELRDSGIRLPQLPAATLAVCVDGETASTFDSTNSFAVFDRPGITSFQDHEHRTIAIVCGESIAEAAALARDTARSLVSGVGDPDTNATVGVGEPFTGAAGFAESYREAVCSLEFRYIAGIGRTVEHGEVPARACHRTVYQREDGTEWSPRFGSAVSALARAMRAYDTRECAAALELLLLEMRRSFISRAESTLQIHSVLVRINELAVELGKPPVPIEAFSGLATLEQVARLMHETCVSMIDAQLEQRQTYGGSKTYEALSFIELNHASPSLSLTSLCKAIAVSPSYFSAVFKSHTGKTFVEHLTEVRVDHAKQLLKMTDLKIYEVAKRVGYRDQHYFCTIFKKSSGRSPMEFRHEAAATGT